MEAPGKGMLKVVSILYIVFGGIWALLMLLSLFLGAALGSAFEGYLGGYGALVGGVLFIVFLIPAAVDLVLGILGQKYCGDPSKSLFFIIVGFILGGITLLSIGSSPLMAIIGLVMPVLFIVGGFRNKNAA